MCCENPIDLGCAGSCSDVVTTIASSCASSFTVSYNFNGATITKIVSHNGIGNLSIPSGTFNENSNTTFAVYDSAGTYIECFKVKITPSMIVAQPTTALQSNITLEKDLCQDGVPTALLPITATIVFNDLSLLANGSSFDIVANMSDGEVYGVSAVSAGISVVNSPNHTITIDDISLLTDNTIIVQINVVITDCNALLTANASLACFFNIPSGTSIGSQNLSNTIQNGN